jgi:hypothetical protein
MEQNDIIWNLQNFIFWKDKINYNKIIMSRQNNLIIVINSVKQHGAQISCYKLWWWMLATKLQNVKTNTYC